MWRMPSNRARFLPCFEVAFRLFAGGWKQPVQRTATRHLLFAEFLVQRGGKRLVGNIFDDIRRNHHDTITVADDDVAWIHRDAATRDRQTEIAWMMRDRTWRRCSPPVIG